MNNVREPIQFFVIKDGVREALYCDIDLDRRMASVSYMTNWNVDSYHWMRFGAENQNGDCIFYTNPVHSGEKEHAYYSFGDLENELQ